MFEMIISEQELVRRNALKRLQILGIDPYPPQKFDINFLAKDKSDKFKEDKRVVMAGRIMSKRIMGKASFVEIKDHTGKIQLYVTRDNISKTSDSIEYNEVFKKLLDIGDIIGVEGALFKTKVGEISVKVEKINILCKSLRPLPIVKTDDLGNVHDSFSNLELRYRMRYVDLIVNDYVKDIFVMRSKIISSMRKFLTDKGYLEVETPILQPIAGGAAARPFITYHNTLDISLYLRIANELYLKRLIVGGFEGVFEFAKNFRNEGMDRTHNPEFTMIELYVAYKDYLWMMELTENMLSQIAREVLGKIEFSLGDKTISFKTPFRKVALFDIIEEKTGYDLSKKSKEEIEEIAVKINVDTDESMGKGKIIDAIFGKYCEQDLIQPTFIIDYPEEMSPLTKKHRDRPGLTERFELFINGKEIANAYSELNDPIDQKRRFDEQLKLLKKGDEEAMNIDFDFLRALEYGMPPTSGIGIGIDRLVMLLTNQHSIQEVILFPQMKPKKIQVALSDEAKTILKHLKEFGEEMLFQLKESSNLSNKKWDKGIKELTSNNIAKVEKREDTLYVIQL